MPETLEPGTSAAPPRFVADLDTLVRARYPLIYLVSWEEQRVDGILADLASAHGKALFSWSVTRGLRRIDRTARTLPLGEGTREPREALSAIAMHAAYES